MLDIMKKRNATINFLLLITGLALLRLLLKTARPSFLGHH